MRKKKRICTCIVKKWRRISTVPREHGATFLFKKEDEEGNVEIVGSATYVDGRKDDCRSGYDWNPGYDLTSPEDMQQYATHWAEIKI